MDGGEYLIGIALLWFIAYYLTKRPKNFPPGPRGFPVLGVAPLVGRRPERKFTEWGKKYGEIIGLKMGKTYTVVLNSYEVIHEALVKNSTLFNDRPDNFIFTDILRKRGPTLNDYTPEYVIERKFAHETLGRLGFGKTAMGDPIMDEANHLLELFGDDDVELNAQTKKRIMYAIGNVTAQVTIGKRYADYSDPEYHKLMDGYESFFRTGSLAYSVTMIFPWFSHVPPVRGSAASIRKGFANIDEVVKGKVAEHEENFDELDRKDFIDEYLQEKRKEDYSENGMFSRDTLNCYVRDLFGASMETVQGTMIFSFLVLANRPELMKRIHDEIDDVIESEGNPRFALRRNMTLCHAFIVEVMRYRTVVPLGIPHCTSKDVVFRGYNIPKGTTILPNFYSLHNDPKEWENPGEFNPYRHIDNDGKVRSSKYFVPFGLGPRLCLGRRLAEVELFIFLVTIFRHYTVTTVPSSKCKRPWIHEDSNFTGLTLCPPAHTPVTLRRRKKE